MNNYFSEIDSMGRIALQYVADVQDRMITRYLLGSNAIAVSSTHAVHPAEGNPSFSFDRESNDMLFRHLERHSLNCHIFSEEESEWKVIGSEPSYIIVADPFCNSWLAARGFHEAAVAICIADMEGELVTCAIGDLQFRRIFFADDNGAFVWHMVGDGVWHRSPIRVNNTKRISEAFLALSLFKEERRKQAFSSAVYKEIVMKARLLHTLDGAIMIGRLAAGDIDGYLDTFQGQPLYEIPCCALILQAGGVVSDSQGVPFHLPDVIAGLRKSRDRRYKLVAACTRELHEQLLAGVKSIATPDRG